MNYYCKFSSSEKRITKFATGLFDIRCLRRATTDRRQSDNRQNLTEKYAGRGVPGEDSKTVR